MSGCLLRSHLSVPLRAAFTQDEIEHLVRESGLERVRFTESDAHHFMIERTGESDPNSWITAREQYR